MRTSGFTTCSGSRPAYTFAICSARCLAGSTDAFGCPGHGVARRDDPRTGKYGITDLGGLGIRDVESGAGNSPFADRLNESGLIDDRPSGDVDEEGARFHHS